MSAVQRVTVFENHPVNPVSQNELVNVRCGYEEMAPGVGHYTERIVFVILAIFCKMILLPSLPYSQSQQICSNETVTTGSRVANDATTW